MNEQFKHSISTISSIYESMLVEGKEAKFKAGDKVGIGSYTNYGYHGRDTGTVTKVNGHGHHTVEFDHRMSSDDPSKKYIEIFDHAGRSKKQYSDAHIIPLKDHEAGVKRAIDTRERNNDFAALQQHILGHRTGAGHCVPFDKETADIMKAIIDKHTKVD